jgi:hypothetical protein
MVKGEKYKGLWVPNFMEGCLGFPPGRVLHHSQRFDGQLIHQNVSQNGEPELVEIPNNLP